MSICSEHQDKEPGCPRCHVTLPDDFGMGEFKPCVIFNEELKLTEMLLEDTMIVWRPWRGTAGMGHAVDLGYDENGKLVGIKIWDAVADLPK